MLTFVRSMMEWLGGTVSKEDVGAEGQDGKSKNSKRRRDDDDQDEALGAFALRFPYAKFLLCYVAKISWILKASRSFSESCGAHA